MKSHHFDKSIEYEKLQSQKADAFYQKQFPRFQLKRFNTNSKEDLVFQKKDIDAKLFSDTKQVFVSEKFREKNFDDIYIEFFSKFPATKGWMENSDADILAIFFPEKMFWIDKKALINFYNLVLKTKISFQFFEEIHRSKKHF